MFRLDKLISDLNITFWASFNSKATEAQNDSSDPPPYPKRQTIRKSPNATSIIRIADYLAHAQPGRGLLTRLKKPYVYKKTFVLLGCITTFAWSKT